MNETLAFLGTSSSTTATETSKSIERDFRLILMIISIVATACTPVGRGSVLTLTGNDPNGWNTYRFNYTATSIRPTIIFGFQNENNREYYLDDVSVTPINATGVQLLTNPSFESSPSNATGWVVWFSSTCSGYTASISLTSCSTGRCFKSKCYASSGIEFLGQSFSAIVGMKYSISFQLNLGGSGNSAANRFVFDIY